MLDGFNIGKQRREIEDGIVARFEKVDFDQTSHSYLQDDDFWDFVFSWYELVRYYERVPDTAIGAHMLALFQQCGQVLRNASSDAKLPERLRDRATDALYQMTYYVDCSIRQAERNGVEIEAGKRFETGRVAWKQGREQDPSAN